MHRQVGSLRRQGSRARVGGVPAFASFTVEFLESRRLLSFTLHGAQPTHIKYNPGGDTGAEPLGTVGPTGLNPTTIRNAYALNNITFVNGTVTGDGSGQTIAIVDAFDNPKFVSSSDANYSTSDMWKFCNQFSLPQFGTPGGPTFTKMNQAGGSSYPSPDVNWGGEIALDVEWAHAIAPKANIVLIEANTNGSDLYAAANFAGTLPGVVAVSMSWGAGESGGEKSLDPNFVHPGVTYFASTGDSGAPGGYPAYSPNVVAVGGTHLTLNGGNWFAETGWAGSGGGISILENKPSYQSGITLSTIRRMIPDVAMDADPNTGVPVYDSFGNGTFAPWSQYGGTSLSSPLWAGIMAIVAQGRATLGAGQYDSVGALTQIYKLPQSDFHDITSGNNGFAAGAGYDLVTGRGSPISNLIVADLVNIPGAPTGLALAPASDTGISSSDAITNINTPTITGHAMPSSTVTLFIGSTQVGQATADAGGLFSITSTAQADGAYGFRASASTAAGSSTLSGTTIVNIDTTAPSVTSGANFVYDQVPVQRLTYSFSESLGGTLHAEALSLNNTSTSQSIQTAQIGLAFNGNSVNFTFPGFANGALPDGQYTATLANADVTDVAGNTLIAPASSSSFYFLNADANHDGTADVTDLGIVATNWQGSGVSFSQGDFNYDGAVDVTDLGILATNWQKTIMPPAPSAPLARTALSSGVVASTPTKRASTEPSLATELLA